MAASDRLLYFVFQIVRVWRFRCDEGIECELRTQAEAGDEAVEGGFAVDGCPGIDILEETFLLLTGELVREEVAAPFYFARSCEPAGRYCRSRTLL